MSESNDPSMSVPMADTSLKSVPCVQIDNHNICAWWNNLLECVHSSHLVAIDLELSGLGDRQKLNAKKIDERYEAIAAAAKTRSVLSIGFAFFQFCDIYPKDTVGSPTAQTTNVNGVSDSIRQNDAKIEEIQSNSWVDINRFEALDTQLTENLEELSVSPLESDENITKDWNLNAKLFNMLCLCEEEYVCEPETMRFLAGHGFDFNGQCLHGLPYNRGNDIEGRDETKPTLRNFVIEIIRRKLPIVLHNGFIDLIFFYHNFYAQLPNDLQTFVSDLADLFPSGIYDTKYIADFLDRLNRSYLEYLFYERQRCNIERAMKGQVSLTLGFPLDTTNSEDIEYKDLSTNLFNESDPLVDICHDYANHGWCRQNHLCPRSHNIDLILDKKKHKNKKLKKIIKNLKKTKNVTGETIPTAGPKEGAHRAGYDAFMTGYCLAFYMAVNSKKRPDSTLSPRALGVANAINNIYLTGKDQSFRIAASSFAKPSIIHKNKISRIRCKKCFDE